MDRSRIDPLTAAQLSLVARRQFLTAGGTPDALRWAVRDRWLEPYRWRGVYAVVGAAKSEYRPLMGACLAAGDKAAASGLGAAWLYAASDIAPGALELTMFAGSYTRLPGVDVRRCELDAAGLVATRCGVPAVVPALCVVQLASRHRYLAERVANEFVKRHVTTFAAILKCLDDVAAHGRGSAELRRFLGRELEVAGHDDSTPARKLGRALRRAGLPDFETQFEVDTPDGSLFLDFAWPAAKVGLEYNGWLDHGTTRSAIDRDARRRARLAALGWVMLDATSGLSRAEVVRWTADALATARLRVSART
jgi:very-short-patch-repair endonuclease